MGTGFFLVKTTHEPIYWKTWNVEPQMSVLWLQNETTPKGMSSSLINNAPLNL